MNWNVGPLLEVRGQVVGTPEELKAFQAEWDQPEPMKRGDGTVGWQFAESQRLETTRIGDVLTFHLTGLRPGTLASFRASSTAANRSATRSPAASRMKMIRCWKST